MSRCRAGDSSDVWYGVDLPLLSKRVMGGEGWPLPLLERPGRQIVIISIIITKYHCHLLRHYHFIISDIVALLPIITIIRRTICNKPKKSIWKCLRVIPLFQYWNEKNANQICCSICENLLLPKWSFFILVLVLKWGGFSEKLPIKILN